MFGNLTGRSMEGLTLNLTFQYAAESNWYETKISDAFRRFMKRMHKTSNDKRKSG